MKEITVPDIGDFKDVAVIEVLAGVGDTVLVDQTIAVLESDKATVDIPSIENGVVADVKIKVGDRVSAGSPLMVLQTVDESAEAPSTRTPAPSQVHSSNVVSLSAAVVARAPNSEPNEHIYAGPSVRKLARELGVDLHVIKGTGPRGRIIASDVSGHVKSVMVRGGARDGAKEGPEASAPLMGWHFL